MALKWYRYSGHLKKCVIRIKLLGVQNDNEDRPHSSLNDLTPYEFLKEQIIPLQDERLNLKLAYTMG